MKRATALLIILVAAMAAQAAPENSTPTNVKDSECYECHKSGGEGSGPILDHIFRIFLAEAPDLTPGEGTELTFDIRNWWTSEVRNINGHLDISGAPELSFNSVKEPVGGSREGALPEYDQVAYYQGTERTARTTMDVAAGGTDLTWSVAPEADSGTDIEVRIWPPGVNPELAAPTWVVDDLGADGTETGVIQGNPVEGGSYTIEVAEDPGTFTLDFDAVGFTVEWLLEYQFDAGESTQAGATNVVLDGQADGDRIDVTQISWNVNVLKDLERDQRVRVYMEAVSVYEHPPQFRAVDEWLYWVEVEYIFAPQADGSVQIQRITPDGNRVTEFIVGDQVIEVDEGKEEGPDLTDEKDAPLDIASEVIGYMAAFLLVISLLTGGAFGNWSRKVQQWMLYRKAKKRVAYHNVISYALIVLATVHMILFLVEPKYPWTIGFFLGGVSIFGMYLSGVTGAFQKAMVRGLGHETWRWLHYLSFVFAFGGAIGHVLLDGIHFAEFQQLIGWEDPVAPLLEDIIPIDDAGAE